MTRVHFVLWIECIGFALIILLSWADELLELPRHLFGGAPHPGGWRESALESILTLLVALFVLESTRRVLRRFHYLESMLTMCAWCRKLEHGDEWLSLEHYCAKELGVDVSHGLCPSCGRQLLQPREPA